MRCKRRSSLSSGLLGLTVGLLLGLACGLFFLPSKSYNNDKSNTKQEQEMIKKKKSLLIDTREKETIKQSSGGGGGLLFVGVMTARRYLETRAKAVYESWGNDIQGRIGFYSSEGSEPPDNCPNLPLIALSKVDDSYPPQKKSFLMLEHMWQQHGDKYEWFLRSDDDLYVRIELLENLLRSIDSRRPYYIGQAGRGNPDERDSLDLDYDENFCMGGPGVLLSRETLKRIIPHVKYCLDNLYTSHEDVELGRCVRRFAGISCTWNYEVSVF